ncbi:hypothetical protein N7451_012737 [Penicillium sp. IBT 35674x]|nr:hypothetical protein N7451_012737 [Penicillium sp. IBT 35674x]
MPCIDNIDGHPTGSGKIRECACQPLPSHTAIQSICVFHNATDKECSTACFAGPTRQFGDESHSEQKFDSIQYVFCLTENEDYADERVYCVAISAERSHLSWAEEWLERRRTGGSGTSCFVREGYSVPLIVGGHRLQPSITEI